MRTKSAANARPRLGKFSWLASSLLTSGVAQIYLARFASFEGARIDLGAKPQTFT